MVDSVASGDRRRVIAGAAVAFLGATLFSVPLYDVWEDATRLNWQLTSTLVENVTLFALAGSLVAGGVWLARSDWDADRVATAASTTFLGTVATAVLFAWIVAVQLWAMHEPKPYVIALDAVLVGAVGSFGVGVYRARTASNRRDLRVERNRLSGLFENTSDAVATLELDGGEPSVSSANEQFLAAFEDPADFVETAVTAADRSLTELFEQDAHSDPVTTELEYDIDVRVQAPTEYTDIDDDRNAPRDGDAPVDGVRGEDDDSTASEDRDDRDAEGGGTREFLVRLVPYDTDRGRAYVYVVATDITEQKQLAREREANAQLERLYEYTSRLASVDSRDDACDVVVEAVRTLLEPSAVRVVVDGDVVAEATPGADRNAGQSSNLDADGVAGQDTDGDADPDVEAFDTTVAIGDRGRIALSGGVAAWERNAVDVLAGHLENVLARLDRERELAEEREELDFINQTLRHNLLNDIQVVRARLETLEGGDEDLEDHRDVVVDHLDRMADFVQTMRTYTKTLIEEDDHVLQPVDLQQALEDVAAGTRDAYGDAAVSLGDVPDVAVQADELLEPVFENLLQNAVEHNDKETPRVHVDAERYDDLVVVRVADNGPGIPDERKEAVFERGELGAHSSGSGFGLFLVKKTVESYGGGVDIRDNEPTGTVVRVTLPVASS